VKVVKPPPVINKEKIKARAAQRLAERSPERIKADKKRQHEYYLRNAERIKKQSSEWSKNNPEGHRNHARTRRALEKNSTGKLSKGLEDKLFKLQKGKCPCCKQPLGDDYHLDHIVPLARGGSNTDDNMQLLRSQCNQQKHAKHPVDFMRERGFLL